MIIVGVAALVSGNYVFVKIETDERITRLAEINSCLSESGHDG